MNKLSCHTLMLTLGAALMSGCASTESTGSTPHAAAPAGPKFATRYKATDGRNIEIGRCSSDNGGWTFRDPHMNKCWIADGFDFKGANILYIAPVSSVVKVHDDEVPVQEIAEKNLVKELALTLAAKGVFVKVVQNETEIPADAHKLKLENTIVKYSKGGGAARYFVGIYGGGQPDLRVQGKLMDGDKVLFSYEAERSGVSASARLHGAFLKDEDIQIEDIRSMTLDLGDFVSAVAGQYQPLN